MTDAEIQQAIKDVGNALADIVASAGNAAGAQIQQTTDQQQTDPQNGGQQS